jgi:hypothetical protein
VKDGALAAYVEAIEAHLTARRGVDHPLSPREFSLARTWHGAGVPLATVLVGIDRAFDSGSQVTSLAYCRRFVDDLAPGGARTRDRPSPTPEAPVPELGERLGALLDRLSELRPGPEACFEPPLRKVEEVRDLLAVAARPNWEYLRAKLREIDQEVSDAAVRALSAADRSSYQAEAARAARRHQGRVDAAALADAVERFTVQRARERFALPRVNLV